ncbi:hypothetical protein [Nonomuraea sp. NPDC050783]|uniref:hypothetical protein n=1 Tax=Nonomuraea sp. NPDC050783 TaxID=3154634 RepID=UPI0034667B99
MGQRSRHVSGQESRAVAQALETLARALPPVDPSIFGDLPASRALGASVADVRRSAAEDLAEGARRLRDLGKLLDGAAREDG